VKELLKSANIWQSYSKNKSAQFFWLTVYLLTYVFVGRCPDPCDAPPYRRGNSILCVSQLHPYIPFSAAAKVTNTWWWCPGNPSPWRHSQPSEFIPSVIVYVY